MAPSAVVTCAHCGRTQGTARRFCEMCSNPLGAAGDPEAPASSQSASSLMGGAPIPPPPVAAPSHGIADYRIAREERDGKEFQRGLNFLALGVPLAFVFGLTPLLQFIGWFLEALFHEIGHSAVAIFSGRPALPKISLGGHAMTAYAHPVWIMQVAVFVGSLGLIRSFLEPRGRIIAVAALVVVYPLMVWTGFGEFMILSGGHLGELAIGAVFLWRCLDGEECHHDAERAAYGMVGWFLCGQNILLSFGLAFSSDARAEYAGSGSFGLTNDYIRIADNVLGTSLETVGFTMGVLGLMVPAAVIAKFVLGRGGR